MKYIEYITNAANSAQQFGTDCLNWAGNVAVAIPEKAAEIGAITTEYAAAAAAASSDFVAAASYESYNAIMNASAKFAEAMGDAVVNAPSYVESLAGMAADYSAAAIAAAQSYLASLEDENNLQWIQKQDNGVYVSGDEGTGQGAAEGWNMPEYWPKYPGDVPLVPPGIIPTNKQQIKKILPPNSKEPEGCASKLSPTFGHFFWLQPRSDGAWRAHYWDNSLIERETRSFDDSTSFRHVASMFAGTPRAIPSLAESPIFASMPNGRFAVIRQENNISVFPPDAFPAYYTQKRGWRWNYRQLAVDDYNIIISEHQEQMDDDFYECTGGNSDSIYSHILSNPNINRAEGEGHAISMTYGYIDVVYIGNFPPVTETEDSAITGAYLAFQQIHAFNNILFTLLGGNYGNS